MKHTIGPWTIVSNQIKAQGGSLHIAGVMELKEREANLKLIAAAPEMLEALEAIADSVLKQNSPYPLDVQKLVASAINKAGG